MNQNEREYMCYLPTRWSIKVNGSKLKNLILQRLGEDVSLHFTMNLVDSFRQKIFLCYTLYNDNERRLMYKAYPKIQEMNIIDFKKEDLFRQDRWTFKNDFNLKES